MGKENRGRGGKKKPNLLLSLLPFFISLFSTVYYWAGCSDCWPGVWEREPFPLFPLPFFAVGFWGASAAAAAGGGRRRRGEEEECLLALERDKWS